MKNTLYNKLSISIILHFSEQSISEIDGDSDVKISFLHDGYINRKDNDQLCFNRLDCLDRWIFNNVRTVDIVC